MFNELFEVTQVNVAHSPGMKSWSSVVPLSSGSEDEAPL